MPDQPNVLLICTDHWPASLLGEAGHPTILTPTLDQVARNGTRFVNAYSECPVCIPARKTLMTGTSCRAHGDRVFRDEPAPVHLQTMAQTFRNSGYQAYAVGKLHVSPQRSRIGFDDVILAEEGRLQFGLVDDYELFLGDQGYVGKQFAHGMCNNDYLNRPWHLPEELHVTNWTTQQMARTIQRRDPGKPGFWYLSYCHPHPPLAPLQCYMDMYKDLDPGEPYFGEWSREFDALPHRLKSQTRDADPRRPHEIAQARRAFYAMCTHIDHQLRVVIGTLREEGLLDNTILMFTSDHGDMLGNHGMWAKRLFYEDSANVPMLLMGVASDECVGHHRVDHRIVGWQDIMPTLLDLAGIEIPETVEGQSMVGEEREFIYGECGSGAGASRMIRSRSYKLIYYPVGNVVQLFDVENDPRELYDLLHSPAHQDVIADLKSKLIEELYGGDEEWVRNGDLVGLPDQEFEHKPNRGLNGQRGSHWPPFSQPS
ncbi:MAG: sulfatase-like hydrolase/transferase [Planctomycetota bacterium]|nr:sulfatase-like hydrolase/transferase [Planctomycetota bacterium]MDA1137112.1 sulfatase-like hydrolase/transferase [Planctomycetota bacterium]